jgi:hypothetical protein
MKDTRNKSRLGRVLTAVTIVSLLISAMLGVCTYRLGQNNLRLARENAALERERVRLQAKSVDLDRMKVELEKLNWTAELDVQYLSSSNMWASFAEYLRRHRARILSNEITDLASARDLETESTEKCVLLIRNVGKGRAWDMELTCDFVSPTMTSEIDILGPSDLHNYPELLQGCGRVRRHISLGSLQTGDAIAVPMYVARGKEKEDEVGVLLSMPFLFPVSLTYRDVTESRPKHMPVRRMLEDPFELVGGIWTRG